MGSLDDHPLLRARGITEAQIVEAITRSLGLDKDHAMVWVAGSLVDGLGHRASDIDLVVVTNVPVAGTRGPFNSAVVRTSDVFLDVAVVQETDFAIWRKRLNEWHAEGSDPLAAMSFTEAQIQALHRTSTGTSVLGRHRTECLELGKVRKAVRALVVARCRHLSTRLQSTVAGMHLIDAWRDLLLPAQMLLDTAVDAHIMAVLGSLPSIKWRLRRLDAAGQIPFRVDGHHSEMSSNWYLKLRHLPEPLVREGALHFAHVTSDAARILLLGAEFLVEGRRPPWAGGGAADGLEAGAIPSLSFGVGIIVRLRDGNVEVFDGGEPRAIIRLSEEMVRCLPWFSTIQCHSHLPRPASSTIMQLAGLMVSQRLVARRVASEDDLQRLLS